MIQSAARSQMNVFFTIWFGQFVSIIGTALTRFAPGIWVYEQTRSATQFTLISLFIMLPALLMSPIAGAFVDRWNRRSAMLLGDVGRACVFWLLWSCYTTTACKYGRSTSF